MDHNTQQPGRTRRGIDALLDDLKRELEQVSRRAPTGVVTNSLTGMLFEIFDAVRYRIDEIAADSGRTALTDDEIAVVVGGARQAIALAVEFGRQDELARARALGERTTAPSIPKGAFERVPGRAGGTVQGMPRARDDTVPIDAHDRVTAPAPAPYKGEPRPAIVVHPAADESFIGPDEATPVGLLPDDQKPTPVRPRGRR